MPDLRKTPRKKLPRQLAVIDGDMCTGCAACIEICPVDCIALIEQHPHTPGLQRFCEIDWDRCIGCKLCMLIPTKRADFYRLLVCPWDAIRMLPPDELPQTVDRLGGPPGYARQNAPRLLAAARRQRDMALQH